MRILFVCGGTGGGAAMSTHELAAALAAGGDKVDVLQAVRGADRVVRVQRRVVNASVKLRARPLARPAARLVTWLATTIGRRVIPLDAAPDGVERQHVAVPENGVAEVLRSFAPDVMVVNSVDRTSWRELLRRGEAARVPVVLYIREESSLNHLDPGIPRPSAVFANARGLADKVIERGVPSAYVPSLVDLDRSAVETTRERVVYVNPIPINGVDVALAVAEVCSEIDFTFVESWRLSDDDVAALQAQIAVLPNVELQRRSDQPRDVYARASVLLAPCRTDTRPRVVLEAQANGIPVLAADQPSLREAVGPGGATVPVDAGADVWADALRDLLRPEHYEPFVAAARRHADRDEVRPDGIVAGVRRVLADAVSSSRRPVAVRAAR